MRTREMLRAGAVLLLTGGLAACTLNKQEAPGLIGPAGSSQQVSVTANPDRFDHDGQSQSTVTVTVRNELGEPVANQKVSVSISTGTAFVVETGSGGLASFTVTAPPLSTPAANVRVFATPFGVDAESSLTRVATIALTGTPVNTTAPTADFTFLPEAPKEGETIVFDASETKDEGQACLNKCFYDWRFAAADGVDTLGSGGGSGLIVPRTNVRQGTYVVTLTVTDNAGTVATKTKSVTVTGPPTP